MQGYYKNDEATANVFTDDGWLRTGDLGTIDTDNRIYIRGRSKTMILGSNGQNIYPEEIEDKLNSLAMVNECVVVQRGEKLVGLVYPDFDEAATMRLNDADLEGIMEQNRQELNSTQPPYCRLSAIEIVKEEFEKTPKKSIKRYLYK